MKRKPQLIIDMITEDTTIIQGRGWVKRHDIRCHACGRFMKKQPSVIVADVNSDETVFDIIERLKKKIKEGTGNAAIYGKCEQG